MPAFAVLLAGLAWGILRGSQAARVITWVVCGVGVLCSCCTGFGALASFSQLESARATNPNQAVGDLLVRALPDWTSGILLGSSGLSLVGYIATAILLTLPETNAFFRGARPPGWQPPTYPQNPPDYEPPPSPPAPPPSGL
jgi:hypothetical protein